MESLTYTGQKRVDQRKNKIMYRPLTASTLSKELAVYTHQIRKQIAVYLDEAKNPVSRFYEEFNEWFSRPLEKGEFSDLFAQTLTFGLLTAATHCRRKLTRKNAYRCIPKSSGILYDLLLFISGEQAPRQMENIIKEIVRSLNRSDTLNLLDEHNNSSESDAITHFYELFLNHYNPGERKRNGVYYTPEPVISFMVRSIDLILKEKLEKPDGLAEIDINILDPASGTSNFLVSAAELAIQNYRQKYGKGVMVDFARNYLMEHLYGYEIMMAPYAVSHFKLSRLLEKMGIHLTGKQRVNLYLTDALDMENIKHRVLPDMPSLSAESRLAGKVKKDIPITVVLGNPPFSGQEPYYDKNKVRRQKECFLIDGLLRDYRRISGIEIQERNLKWLQDDYVKFIRLAQSKIESNGEGVVGFVTNNGFLDNPTFRGMRYSLMTGFDEIYVLDLHGNAMKNEKCPDGTSDRNIFDIRQGVAVVFFVKKKSGSEGCRVFHADLWGVKEQKFRFLSDNDLGTVQWEKIEPKWEFYLFKPYGSERNQKSKTTTSGGSRYSDFFKVTDIFPVHSVGIITSRDRLTISETPEEAFTRASEFAKMGEEEARTHFDLGDDTRDWQVRMAQDDVANSGVDKEKVVPILYRPFDTRYTYYTGNSRGYHSMPRPNVMKHLLEENIGLVTVRQVAEREFSHCFITKTITDSRVTSSNKGIAFIFPLYIYYGIHSKRRPNLHPAIIDMIKNEIMLTPVPSPEEILYYIYAVLSSNSYRKKYEKHLKIDFPRIPFTADRELFKQMSKQGESLASIHLMESKELDQAAFRFPESGSNTVRNIRFDEDRNILFINKFQYFSGIPKEVWECQLAGYQVLKKWLRNHRQLSHSDVMHLIRIARSVELTICYQEAIDRLYPDIEKNLKR